MRIVLSNIGTFGHINPLIVLALNLKRPGHQPIMAVPAVYEKKIISLRGFDGRFRVQGYAAEYALLVW